MNSFILQEDVMVKVRYVGKRPCLLDGFYIHNDEVRNISENTALSLDGNADFEFLDQPAVVVTPAPIYEIDPLPALPQIGEELPNLGEEKQLKKRGKKK
jgi:hypothetical protein